MRFRGFQLFSSGFLATKQRNDEAKHVSKELPDLKSPPSGRRNWRNPKPEIANRAGAKGELGVLGGAFYT